jgi:hypothetical protein
MSDQHADTWGGIRPGAGRPPLDPEQQKKRLGPYPHKPSSKPSPSPRPKAEAEPSDTTRAQREWLAQNPQYQIETSDRGYVDRGVLSPKGSFYAGEYDLARQPRGYVGVGVRQLSSKEKKAARQRRWRAKEGARSKETEWQRRRRAEIRSNPAEHARVLARQRELWHRRMSDPQARAAELRRSREKSRRARAAKKAAEQKTESFAKNGTVRACALGNETFDAIGGRALRAKNSREARPPLLSERLKMSSNESPCWCSRWRASRSLRCCCSERRSANCPT